jgi:hypothetical protein
MVGSNEGLEPGEWETINVWIGGQCRLVLVYADQCMRALGMLLLHKKLPPVGGTVIECQLPKGRSGLVKQMPTPEVSSCSLQG